MCASGFGVNSGIQGYVCIEFYYSVLEVGKIHCECNYFMNGVQIVKEFIEMI